MISAWLKVVGLGIAKWPFKVLAPFVVPFLSDEQRRLNPIFGVADATDLSWYNIAIRNGCHNMITVPMPPWITVATNTPEDPSMELRDGLQWRYRRSHDGKYVSFRVTWGAPRKKGKREFYVGWTLNDRPYARLTFFQLRPF